jgi:hypothetical protein
MKKVKLTPEQVYDASYAAAKKVFASHLLEKEEFNKLHSPERTMVDVLTNNLNDILEKMFETRSENEKEEK